jgi:hypothetical protein
MVMAAGNLQQDLLKATTRDSEGPGKALVKDNGSISKNTENLRTWAKIEGDIGDIGDVSLVL